MNAARLRKLGFGFNLDKRFGLLIKRTPRALVQLLLTDLKELSDLPNDRLRIRYELQIKYILKLSAFRLSLGLQPNDPS